MRERPEVGQIPRASQMPRPDLPAYIGFLSTELSTAVMRLHEPGTAPAPVPPRILTAVEAAAMAGVAPRWLMTITRGMPFRCDLSKKFQRVSEPGFRAWLERRKR